MVDIVKIVVKYLNEPDADYAVNFGKNFLTPIFRIIISQCVDIGKEYIEKPTEFNRKALEAVKNAYSSSVW